MISLYDIATVCASRNGITVDEMKGKAKNEPLINARLDFISVGVSYGYSQTEISKFIKRNTPTISYHVKHNRRDPGSIRWELMNPSKPKQIHCNPVQWRTV